MALKIRLARGGAKKRPFYSIVVADSRSPRDGRFIEKLGTYNPMLDKGHAERAGAEGRAHRALARARRAADRPRRALPRRCRPARRSPSSTRRRRSRRPRPRRKSAPRPRPTAAAAPPPARAGPSVNRELARRDAASRASASASSPAPHGVKGLVRVKSFTAEPEAHRALRRRSRTKRGARRFALELVGAGKGVLLARIAGVERSRRGRAAERHAALSAARRAAAARGRGVLPCRPARPRGGARRRHAARHGARGPRFRRRRQPRDRASGRRDRWSCRSPARRCRWSISPAGAIVVEPPRRAARCARRSDERMRAMA